MSEIAAWLENLGLGKYIETFAENDIDIDVLPELTEKHFKELGVSLGHRVKLLKAISALSSQQRQDSLPSDALAPISPITGSAERRQLTVMFTDLVGSTALSEQLDPEDLSEIIRRYQDMCAGIISRFGGYVAKFMGDGILVYFGYPQAHEDDAERAVRAGLDIVYAVGGLAAPGRTGLQVRIGVATGLVVVGELIGSDSAQERTVVGETPNLAARLQALAAPGQIVIAEVSRRLLGGQFELSDLGEHYIKGLSGPVRAFEVRGVSAVESRFEARRGGKLGAMLGREHELVLLLERWRCARAGTGQLALLSGEPGIGKSRLTRALIDALAAEDHYRIDYQCSPYHSDSALYPVVQQLAGAAGFTAGDGNEARLDKLEALLQRTGSPRELALLARLLDLDGTARYGELRLSPQQQLYATLDALIGQFVSLAGRRPVLLVIEDVHWIDPSTLELVERALDAIAEARVLLLLTARPEFEPAFASHPRVARIVLGRLGPQAVSGIIHQLTGGKILPAKVIEEMVAKSDGVPLYVEELTRAIVGAGFLRDAGERYELYGSLAEIAIPETLQDSLMARLDRLPGAREVAQLGAVFGRKFSYEMLQAVAGLDEPALQAGLSRLVEEELLYRRGRGPQAHYVFKHALIQDIAYQSLLRRNRQQAHRRIAELLQDRYSELAETDPELLAHHYTQAGLPAQAIGYWEQAARRAIERSTYAEAVSHISNAIALLDGLPGKDGRQAEFRLQLTLGKVYRALKGSASQETERAYRRAHALSKELDDREQVVPVLYGLLISNLNRPNLSATAAIAGEIAAEARRTESRTAWLVSQQSAGCVAFLKGDFTAAIRHFGEIGTPAEADAKELAAFSENQYPSMGLTYLSWTLFVTGRPEQALARMQEALEYSKAVSDFIFAMGLGNACYLFQFCRNVAAVGATARQLVEIANARGMVIWENIGRLFAGWSKIFAGDPAADLGEMERALQGMISRQHEIEIPYLTSLLAESCLKTGQTMRGLQYLELGLYKVEANGERWFEAELHRLNGQLLLANGGAGAAGAEGCFRRALDITRRQGAKMWELRAAISLARLWRDQGKRREARDLLAPVYNRFTEGFDTADLEDAKALLEALA